MSNSEFNDYYFNKIYDDLYREQNIISNNIKNDANNKKDNQKQFLIINNLLINLMKLKDIRNKMKENENK